MKKARWWSQPFPPDGGTASDGIRKQLGTPELDPLTVLLRETAQNSWDARLEEAGGVEVTYRLTTIKAAAGKAFASQLRPGPEGSGWTPDSAFLADAVILQVSDRGTTGLGGPLRSDTYRSGDAADFVNFLRNVGEARDRDLGGGTYGFGKGALFRVSGVSAILVDTRCADADNPRRRLMGAALGGAFVSNGRRYTGRHWWGVVGSDDIPDPVLETDAEKVAQRLGLCGFVEGETGTDIYVLDAQLGENEDGTPRTAVDAGKLLAGAAAWYLWPKLIPRNGRVPMKVTVDVDGTPISVPSPASDPRLRPFARALQRIDSGGAGAEPIERASKPKQIGTFAIELDPVLPRSNPITDGAAPFVGPSHHCARMRSVDLVVDYLEGPAHPDRSLQYGAVFRASDEADEHFAAAEPPTHDDWVTRHLSGTDLGVVRGAGTSVKKKMQATVAPAAEESAAADVPLGKLSSALARVLPGVAGDGGGTGGPGGSSTSARGSSKGSRTPFALVGPPTLTMVKGELRVAQRVRISEMSKSIRIAGSASVAVEGRREGNAPDGSAVPTVLGWMSESGWTDGIHLDISPDAPREWELHVRPVKNTATVVDVALDVAEKS